MTANTKYKVGDLVSADDRKGYAIEDGIVDEVTDDYSYPYNIDSVSDPEVKWVYAEDELSLRNG